MTVRIIQLQAKGKWGAFSIRFTEQEKLRMMGFPYVKHLC